MGIFLSIFCFLIASSFLVILFIKRRHQYWKKRNVAHIKPEFYYGNSRGMGKDYPLGELWRKLYLQLKSEKPLVGAYVLFQPVAMATDLDLVKTIMVKDFNTFPNRGSYHNEKDDPVSANLASLEDERWRTLRNKLTPTFTSGKLKLMFQIMSDIADNMLRAISRETEKSGQIEVKDILSRLTTDVIGKAAFGIECNSLDDKENRFHQMGMKAFNSINMFKRFWTQRYPNIARKLRITTSNPEVVNFYRDIVQQTIKYREENNIESNDFMGLLIKMKNSAQPLTFNEIWAQSVIFFTAGFETTATTLTYCMYELSIHKDLQQKARESVLNVLARHNGEFTYEAVNEMQYVEQCINESLRKYPPASATRRVANEDYHVPNTNIVIEKGTGVMIPIYGFHYDPDIFPNPEKYDPDRFAQDQVEKRHKFAFLPFGEGNRNCIGERFAMVELKVALAKILINFEFELDGKRTPVPLTFFKQKLLLTPSCGVYVNFKKIN